MGEVGHHRCISSAPCQHGHYVVGKGMGYWPKIDLVPMMGVVSGSSGRWTGFPCRERWYWARRGCTVVF